MLLDEKTILTQAPFVERYKVVHDAIVAPRCAGQDKREVVPGAKQYENVQDAIVAPRCAGQDACMHVRAFAWCWPGLSLGLALLSRAWEVEGVGRT